MYSFFMPVRIFAGSRCLFENPSGLILGTKAAIITGASSARLSGALADVTAILNDRHIPYEIFDRVENNPTLECAYAAGQFTKQVGADFIIGIGGGSPLDTAKAAAVYAANDMEPMDIYSADYSGPPLPICAIPTTAGTGSEVTPYSILTLTKEQTKKSFSSPACFPKAAFLDGRYTKKLPLQIARNTAADAISHCIEGYLNTKSSPASDYIALKGLSLFQKHLKAFESDTFDENVCTELLFASSLGGIVISQTGTTIVHSMGYQLTYHKDIPHGMANGLLLGEFLKRCALVKPEKAQAALSALGFSSIETLQDWLSQILPCQIHLTDEEIDRYTDVSIQAKNCAVCPFPITKGMEMEIFRTIAKR